MADETMVMYDSPEAATYRTDIKGWVSRDGRYYGEDEHIARWSGCTHMTCACGQVYAKDGAVRCRSCQATHERDRYYVLEMVEWDGTTPVVTDDDDHYFFSEDEVLDYLADQEEGAEIRLVLCKPGRLSYVSEDNWADDLPEDGELPAEVQKALEALNEAIKNAPTVCWWPGKQRINMEPLWAQLKADKVASNG